MLCLRHPRSSLKRPCSSPEAAVTSIAAQWTADRELRTTLRQHLKPQYLKTLHLLQTASNSSTIMMNDWSALAAAVGVLPTSGPELMAAGHGVLLTRNPSDTLSPLMSLGGDPGCDWCQCVLYHRASLMTMQACTGCHKVSIPLPDRVLCGMFLQLLTGARYYRSNTAIVSARSATGSKGVISIPASLLLDKVCPPVTPTR